MMTRLQATVAFTALSFSLIQPPQASASGHQWKEGETCAYATLDYGLNAPIVGGHDDGIIDIREVLDTSGRAVGVLYSLQNGRFALEANALMPRAELARYHLRIGDGGVLWSGLRVVNPGSLPNTVIPCRREHIVRTPVSSFRVQRDAYHAYREGRDHIPDPGVDLFSSR